MNLWFKKATAFILTEYSDIFRSIQRSIFAFHESKLNLKA